MLGVEQEYVVSDYFIDQVFPEFGCDLQGVDSK